MKNLFIGIAVGILSTVCALAVFNFIPLRSNNEVSSILPSSNNAKYIQADYDISKILINGVDTGTANLAFISYGVTYVPLRTLSEILNNTVNWDQDARTISITNNSQLNTYNAPSVNAPSTPIPDANYTPGNVNENSYIGIEAAKQIALNEVGGGTVVSYKEDLYEFMPKYEFKIINNYTKYEVEVNARTGDIIKFKID